MSRTFWRIASLAIALAPPFSHAATVTFPDWTVRTVTSQEIADGAPAGAKVLDFFVTTDSDIVAVDRVLARTTGSFYQHTTAPDVTPPIPGITADSWIDTRGNTWRLGLPFPDDGTAQSAWGDIDVNGPQTNFNFARLVISPASAGWSFSGQVTVALVNDVQEFPFLLSRRRAAEEGYAGSANDAESSVKISRHVSVPSSTRST
jgi:hypothetical protein